MNKKTIIPILIFVVIALIYIFWNNGALNPNKSEISDDVYLVKDNHKNFSIYCEIRGQKLIASSVDSIILTPRYGTMIYGIGRNKINKEWYYIDASSTKNIHGGWTDSTFRNESIVTIGRNFLNSVKTPNEIWNNNN